MAIIKKTPPNATVATGRVATKTPHVSPGSPPDLVIKTLNDLAGSTTNAVNKLSAQIENVASQLTVSGVSTSLTPTGVVPGSYTSTNLTVNEYGQLTAASDGSAGSTYTGTAPIVVTGTVISENPSTPSQNGYMSAVQAAELAYVVASGVVGLTATSPLFLNTDNLTIQASSPSQAGSMSAVQANELAYLAASGLQDPYTPPTGTFTVVGNVYVEDALFLNNSIFAPVDTNTFIANVGGSIWSQVTPGNDIYFYTDGGAIQAMSIDQSGNVVIAATLEADGVANLQRAPTSATSPIFINSNVASIQASSTSQNGYMSAVQANQLAEYVASGLANPLTVSGIYFTPSSVGGHLDYTKAGEWFDGSNYNWNAPTSNGYSWGTGGFPIASLSPAGNLTISGIVAFNPTPASIVTNNLSVGTTSASGIPLTVSGFNPSQSADLFDVWNYTGGTKEFSIDPAGDMTVQQNATIGGNTTLNGTLSTSGTANIGGASLSITGTGTTVVGPNNGYFNLFASSTTPSQGAYPGIWTQPSTSAKMVFNSGAVGGSFYWTDASWNSANAVMSLNTNTGTLSTDVYAFVTAGSDISGQGGAGKGLLLATGETNSATAIGLTINSTNSLTTAGSKLISVQNNGTETANFSSSGLNVFGIAATSGLYFQSAGTGGKLASGSVWQNYDGTNFQFNIPATSSAGVIASGVNSGLALVTQKSYSWDIANTNAMNMIGIGGNALLAVSGLVQSSGLLFNKTTGGGSLTSSTQASIWYDGSNTNINTPTVAGLNLQRGGVNQVQIATNGTTYVPGEVSVSGLLQASGLQLSPLTSGAGTLGVYLVNTYAIVPSAYTAGVDQVFTATMTGAALGDSPAVGYNQDVHANTGAITAQVTSAGNIAIVFSPLNATTTATPASGIATVRLFR